MHDLRQREASMDPSNPFLKYPEEIKNQRLQGVLGYTKHDILYANMEKPVVIEVPSNSTEALESADTSPEGNTLLKVGELELSVLGESSCDESLESSESDKEIENDLIDSDCEKEMPDKFRRLKRMVAREPLIEMVESDSTKTEGRGKPKAKQASVVDLTGESDDELEVTAVNEITDLVEKIMIQSSDGDEESENFHANSTTPITLKGSNRKFCGDDLKSAVELMRLDALSSGVPSQCPMTPRMVKEYDEAIALGQMLESREEHLVATKHYLAALSICDVDVELHRKLFNLKSKLETAAVVTRGRSFS